MNTGMLWWFGGDKKKALKEKIIDAALYYRRKFDLLPELCLVNLKDLQAYFVETNTKLEAGEDLVVDAPEHIKVTVRSSRITLPEHLWIGVEDMSKLPTSESELPA